MRRIIYVMATAAIVACHKDKETAVTTTALPVEVAHPTVKELTLTREYPGYLAADATISIVGRVNGTIIKRSFTEGDRVKKGDALFVIEPTLYQNAVEQAAAAVKTAEARLAYARSNYERMKIAIGSDAVSQIELLQAKSNVESSEAALDDAQAALKSAKTKLGYCYIKAPEDGAVGLAQYPVGAYISGEMSPAELCKLYKDNIMYAFFDITDNQWLKKIQQGAGSMDQSNISFTIGDSRLLQRDAKIDFLAPSVNLSTGTLQVRAELDNSNGALKPGSYISVTMPYEEVKEAILVHDASIGTDQLGKYLYIVNDSNRVEYRRIDVGALINDTMRLVTAGLKPNERYVTKALLKVRNGMPVTPIMDKKPAQP
ncbi:MAG: efflux RND transporter periplasmic adaptor subunit [Bacteroidaceae bacterium]|nr:efflux RND transporter periplasmic adaptor subunit [Bacteroidaceae bacterium]